MIPSEMTAAAPVRLTRSRFEKVLLVVVRLGLAYLFFTQLFWKLPPTFGCPADFAFTTGAIDSGRIRLERTTGLCDWLGIQLFYAENRDLRALEANLDNTGAPELFLNLTFLRQINGGVVRDIIMPNIALMGWLIWLAELSIVLLVGLGLFSRLGGLIALGVSAQLYVGLGGIPSPYEWEWVYLNMILLSLVVIATAPGRFYGLDALIAPRLKAMNNPIARVLLLFTGA